MRAMGLMAGVAMVSVALAGPASAQEPDDTPWPEMDAVFASFTADGPGCAVGIARGGELMFAKGYGLAHVEHGVAITNDTIFRIASVSKQFTAASIALLAEREEIDLDADIHTYLPELFEYDRKVTVRQMIHHISGMGDYGGFEVRPGEPFRFGDQDYWTTEQFMAEVIKKPLEHEANAGFNYSNLAYFLLGQTVERVSGKTLREFANDELFAPGGMDDTMFYDNVREIVPGRAQGYTAAQDGSFTIGMTNLDWVGDGGVHTNLKDMARWDHILSTGDIEGGNEFIAKLHTPYISDITLLGGEGEAETGYAYGMNVSVTEDGEKILQHSGGWVGHNAHFARFEGRDFSVIALCNRNDGLAFGRYDGMMEAAQSFVAWADE